MATPTLYVVVKPGLRALVGEYPVGVLVKFDADQQEVQAMIAGGFIVEEATAHFTIPRRSP